MQILTEKPPLRDTFSSLRVPNYRLFFGGNIVANTAVWMQRITMDWLVLQLSHSVAWVGVTVFFQFTPMLLFGLYGGVIVDRYSKRRLLMMTQSASAVCAAILAALALSGTVEVWHCYAISFALGCITVIDNPARQVFVNELVGPKYMRNAISLNSSVFQLGGLIGPAIGGVLITAVGAGWSFGINAIACLCAVTALALMNPAKMFSNVVVSASKGQLTEGLRYVKSKPVIFWTVIMVAVLSLFAYSMPVFLTAFAHNVYHVGAQGYGFFNALVAAGALAGALLSTRRTGVRLGIVISAAAGLGLMQALAGASPDEILFGVFLIGVGVFNLLMLTAANSLVQMSSNVMIRGRVMSVYVLVLLGGQAIGGPLMGLLVDTIGPNLAMIVSGLLPVVVAALVSLRVMRTAQLRIRFSLRTPRSPRSLVRIVPRVPVVEQAFAEPELRDAPELRGVRAEAVSGAGSRVGAGRSGSGAAA